MRNPTRAREFTILLGFMLSCCAVVLAAPRNIYGLPYPSIHDRNGVNGINFFAANGSANSYSIGQVVAGGHGWDACQLTLSADVSFGDSDDLKMHFRAVDDKGRPYGQINGPGTADDFSVKAKNNFRWIVKFRTGPVSDAKSVFLWAEVRDSRGKAVSRSLSQEMKLVSFRRQVVYGPWTPTETPWEWTRPVHVMVIWNGDRRITGVRVKLTLHSPPQAARSWLEKTRGVTSEKPELKGEFKALNTIQYVQWKPGTTHQLHGYRVSAAIERSAKARSAK